MQVKIKKQLYWLQVQIKNKVFYGKPLCPYGYVSSIHLLPPAYNS